MGPSRTLDAEIDRLYQLPLDEFTAARNALAKQSGGDAARIRALTKPPVPAWAVNQLFWRERSTWDDLIAAAENARKVNRAVLAGRGGDVRAANKVHEEAVEQAFKSTLSLLAASPHPATDATRQAISTTLRALPAGEPPGRLTRPLQPGGFEALAGLSLKKSTKEPKETKEPKAKEPEGRKDAAARVRQRQAEAAAARALKDAEAAARRGEFEKARAEREARRAAEAVEKARDAVARATEELERAERDAKQASDASRTAADRARKAQEAVARAKARED